MFNTMFEMLLENILETKKIIIINFWRSRCSGSGEWVPGGGGS